MSSEREILFENYLKQQNERAWAEALPELLPFVHEVDQTATQIWFAFYPLNLHRLLEQSEDPAALARKLLLQGQFALQNQIDSSHHFLYGHRFWPDVKKSLEEHAASFDERTDAGLAAQILSAARAAAARLNVGESLLVGITAAAFMTLRQAGLEAFKAAPGKISLDSRQAKKSPAQILQARARDDGQGLLGFLKTVDKEWTVTFDENDPKARYKLIDMEDLAAAAARDKSRDWRSLDPRCIEGPIPVECRSASCGTCWVGVLGGAGKLSEVSVREGKKIKEFGYLETSEPKPLIRLACMAQAAGAVSIVIPPWNGVFGQYLQHAQQEPEQAAAPPALPESGSAGDQTVEGSIN